MYTYTCYNIWICSYGTAQMQLYAYTRAIYSHSLAIYLSLYRATRGKCFITYEQLTQDY